MAEAFGQLNAQRVVLGSAVGEPPPHPSPGRIVSGLSDQQERPAIDGCCLGRVQIQIAAE